MVRRIGAVVIACGTALASGCGLMCDRYCERQEERCRRPPPAYNAQQQQPCYCIPVQQCAPPVSTAQRLEPVPAYPPPRN